MASNGIEDSSKRNQHYGISSKDYNSQKNDNSGTSKNPTNLSNLMSSKPIPRGKTKNNSRKESFAMLSYQTETGGLEQKFNSGQSSGFTTASNIAVSAVIQQKSAPTAN